MRKRIIICISVICFLLSIYIFFSNNSYLYEFSSKEDILLYNEKVIWAETNYHFSDYIESIPSYLDSYESFSQGCIENPDEITFLNGTIKIKIDKKVISEFEYLKTVKIYNRFTLIESISTSIMEIPEITLKSIPCKSKDYDLYILGIAYSELHYNWSNFGSHTCNHQLYFLKLFKGKLYLQKKINSYYSHWERQADVENKYCFYTITQNAVDEPINLSFYTITVPALHKSPHGAYKLETYCYQKQIYNICADGDFELIYDKRYDLLTPKDTIDRDPTKYNTTIDDEFFQMINEIFKGDFSSEVYNYIEVFINPNSNYSEYEINIDGLTHIENIFGRDGIQDFSNHD